MSIDEADLYNGYCTQLCRVANRLKEKNSLLRPFIKKPGASNHKAPADSMDWEPSIGQVAAAINDAVRGRKLCTKWIIEKKLAWRREEKLCFRYNGNGHRAQNCLYLPVKRPMAPAEINNKKKATKVIVISDKKAARF